MRDSLKVTFVTPHVGRKDPKRVDRYVRSWQMTNLPVATLAGITPGGVEIGFYDERMEHVDLDAPTDLAAITIETYNAKRAYELAAEYRARGVPVIMGGYHASLVPDEVGQYADSVLLGFAEGVWERVVADAFHNRLERRYEREAGAAVRFGMPNRTIFGKRNYLDVSLVETGRGCPQRCNFCTITKVAKATYHPRPIEEVVADIEAIIALGQSRTIFFVDDNIVGNMRHAKELFRAIAPLRIRWFSQGTLNMARDEELLGLMRESGCAGVLIGFESLKKETLVEMDKYVNVPFIADARSAVARLHAHGIAIYGTFIFGYSETAADFSATTQAAIEMDLFMAAFNQLIPFPGTPLHETLLRDGRMPDPQWYLDPKFRFGEVPFDPAHITREELHQSCLNARKTFYSFPSVVRRMKNTKGNLNTLSKVASYFYINGLFAQEIAARDGLPLGNADVRPQPVLTDDRRHVPASL